MKTFSNPTLKSYIFASKLLQIITFFELIVIIVLIPTLLYIPEESTIFSYVLRIYLSLFLISLPIFSQLDARSRFQNYKQIKDQLYAYGFDKRIFKPIIKSRCQRDAALLACDELGYKNIVESHFRTFGYRWYHILPDYVIKKPQFLFTKYFWKTTFFTPTYYPKFNFEDISRESNELTLNRLNYG